MITYSKDDREKLIDDCATERLRVWVCPKHNVKINLTSKCPLCEDEKNAVIRKKEFERINKEEEKINPFCKIGKALNKSKLKLTPEEFREKRRLYMREWAKKKGKDYFREASRKTQEKKRIAGIERSL